MRKISGTTPCTSSMMNIITPPECSSVPQTFQEIPFQTKKSRKIFRRSIWTRHWQWNRSTSLKTWLCQQFTPASMLMCWKACQMLWEKMDRRLNHTLRYWFSWNLSQVWFQPLNLTSQETCISNDLTSILRNKKYISHQ